MFRQGSALLLRSNNGAGGLGAVQGPPQLPPMWSVGDQPSFGAGWPWWMEGPQKVTWSCHQVIFQDITEPGRDGAEGHGGDRGWGSEWLLVDGFVPGLCSELGNSSLSLQFGERISDPAIWGTHLCPCNSGHMSGSGPAPLLSKRFVSKETLPKSCHPSSEIYSSPFPAAGSR